MFDSALRRIIDPALDRLGRGLAARGFSADQITLIGLGFGLGAAAAIVAGWDWAALALLLAGRISDGLDGAVARATALTDRGGFLDIVCDFIVYGAIPLAFGLRDPSANAVAAGVLLFAFYVNGASFLSYAAMMAKRGLTTTSHGAKSLYFTAGLTEGAETIAVFTLMILWPSGFATLALVFAALVITTALARMRLAWTTLKG